MPTTQARPTTDQANYCLIPWLQEGYQTGLALWDPQVWIQATFALNLINPAAGVLRRRARSPTEVSEQPHESSEESAEPELTSSADPELTHYGELESFCSDLHTFISWGQDYFGSLNNEELNTCMRA